MATKTRPGKLAACTCSTFEFGQYGPDGSAESFTTTGTDCTQMTHRAFAQGHDAKLVGFLVRAEMNGLEIRKGVQIFSGAVQAAQTISEALAAKTKLQLEAAHRRAMKKGRTKAAVVAEVEKAIKPGLPASVVALPTTREARIKVGRWEYDATIVIATGEATHARKLGGMRTVARGEYKEI